MLRRTERLQRMSRPRLTARLPVAPRAWRGLLATITAAALTAVPVIALMPAQPASADAVRDTQMWVLNMLHVQSVWQQQILGDGVVVAVIDSGVDATVNDLSGSVESNEPNFSGVTTPESNPNWGVHGTWMASLIAGHGNPGSPGVIGSNGIVGTAPGSRVLSIRVITDPHDPDSSEYQHESASQGQHELAKAITYAVRHGASVISMSLGYSQQSRVVRQALQDAYDHNVVVVASAGNSGDTDDIGHAPYSFPANYPGVLGVAAVNRQRHVSTFSSQNLSVQVAAPGTRVPAEGRGNFYWFVSGTSPACALTAGVVALIKSRYPKLTDPQVISAITSTTSSKPHGGYDPQIGFGIVNADAALVAAGKLADAARPPATDDASSHFGGGVRAIPAPPVAPRGPLGLILYCLLGAACLAVVALATSRLLAVRDAAFDRTAALTPAGPLPGTGYAASGMAVPRPWPDDPDATGPVPIWRPDSPVPPSPRAAGEQLPPGRWQAAPPGGEHDGPGHG
jgi:subtilisin family serine protease